MPCFGHLRPLLSKSRVSFLFDAERPASHAWAKQRKELMRSAHHHSRRQASKQLRSRRRGRLFEALEARQLFTGSITGNVYVDRNGSLSHDAGDAGYAGFPGPNATVYIDSNDNGALDAGELSTVPD